MYIHVLAYAHLYTATGTVHVHVDDYASAFVTVMPPLNQADPWPAGPRQSEAKPSQKTWPHPGQNSGQAKPRQAAEPHRGRVAPK